MAETEAREVRVISGSSGIKHEVIAVGVDDARKRLLIVSAEADARSAALAQADMTGTIIVRASD